MSNTGQQTAHRDDEQSPYLRAIESEPDLIASTVATDLVRARTHLGLDIDMVAEDLRIRKDHLQAIEDGRFDALPGPVYVVGFLRSYSNYLGLDADDIVGRFKTESMGFEAPQKLHFPEPPDGGRLPKIPLLIAALVMAGVGYVGWYYVTSESVDVASLIPEVPGRLADMVPTSEDGAAEPEEAQPETAQAPAGPQPAAVAGAVESATPAEAGESATVTAAVEAPVAEEPAATDATGEVETTAAAPEATEPETTATPEPAPAADEAEPTAVAVATDSPEAGSSAESSAPAEDQTGEPESRVAHATTAESQSTTIYVPPPPEVSEDYVPRVYGQSNSGSRIQVKARLESWVQVTGDNNELLITRILRPGDVYNVPDREGLFLMTGNAGGIDVLVDGAVTPALGPVNAVRRNIALVPERLISGTAVP